MSYLSTIRSEKGSVLLVSILVLFILTLIGIAATTTTTIDLQISRNERDYVQEFYVADSGWKEAANWLNDSGAPPPHVNSTGNIVRNFGNGAQDVTNNTFPAGTQDGIMNGVEYWYKATYLYNEIAPGNAGDYRKFGYHTASNASRAQEIEVAFTKIFKEGY